MSPRQEGLAEQLELVQAMLAIQEQMGEPDGRMAAMVLAVLSAEVGVEGHQALVVLVDTMPWAGVGEPEQAAEAVAQMKRAKQGLVVEEGLVF
jgi:hypothetical protein